MPALVWTCLVLHPAAAWQHMLLLPLMLLMLPACCGVRLRENSGDSRKTPFGRERALKREKQKRNTENILKTKSKVENHVFLGALFKCRFLFTLLLLPPGRNGNRDSAAGCAIVFVFVFIFFARVIYAARLHKHNRLSCSTG